MIVPAVAVNVAVVLPEPTFTDAGTGNPAALLDKPTVAPPVFDTVTVQVVLAPLPRLAGLQLSPVTVIADTSDTAAVWLLPFRDAVMVAVWSLVMVPAVDVKVAVVLPEPTATEAGVVSSAELSDRVTVAPPVFDTVTVQVALAPLPRPVGTQLSPLRVTGATSETVVVWVLPFRVAVMVAV